MNIKTINLCALCTSLVLFICWMSFLARYHRFNYSDTMEIIKTQQYPVSTDNPSCKIVNGTHFQCLANIFFIGASKCGTTSFVDYLKQHQNINFIQRHIMPRDHHQEVHRFDRSSFALANKRLEIAEEWASSPQTTNQNSPMIHYTPHYFYAPSVPYDIKRHYPQSTNLKFLLLLRNPVDRAISSYWFRHSKLFHDEDEGSWEDLLKSIKTEISQRREFEKCMDSISLSTFRRNIGVEGDIYGYYNDNNNYNNNYNSNYNKNSSGYRREAKHRGQLYQQPYRSWQHCFGSQFRAASLGSRDVDKGVYIDQLQRWFANFLPDRFFIISLEQFIINPCKYYTETVQFFGETTVHNGSISCPDFAKKRLVQPNSRQSSTSILGGGAGAGVGAPGSTHNTTAIKDEVYRILEDYYLPYNTVLFQYLNRSALW